MLPYIVAIHHEDGSVEEITLNIYDEHITARLSQRLLGLLTFDQLVEKLDMIFSDKHAFDAIFYEMHLTEAFVLEVPCQGTPGFTIMCERDGLSSVNVKTVWRGFKCRKYTGEKVIRFGKWVKYLVWEGGENYGKWLESSYHNNFNAFA